MSRFYFIILVILFSSCYKGKKVDLIIHNGNVYIMNDHFEISEAIAIMDGEIVEVGPERQIMNKYRASVIIDAKSKDIFPGFHDAHGHIMSLAKQMQIVDLTGTRSYYEMISRLEKHQSKTRDTIIVGRGWDQSLWGNINLPNDSLLNVVFPHTPVALTRIDGHAMLINQAMREYIRITDSTQVEGGQIVHENGKFTGILLDYALELVYAKLPKPRKEDLKKAIVTIQDNLLAYGITHVHEAGLNEEERELFIELAEEKKLKIYVYAMLYPSPGNIQFAKDNGHYQNGYLSIRSFKVIADGALGSYGACLLQPYSDKTSSQGMLLHTVEELKRIAEVSKEVDYQLNTHCIGDSANRVMLHIIDTLMRDKKEHRWRIEHAQIVHPNDFKLFSSARVLPSVQPTHATSDRRWAVQRLGEERLNKEGYAYHHLQKESGMILFGTDFPIEDYNPFATIHAAVQRKDLENEPLEGFLKEEAVTLDVALKAMTLWPSYGCFDESRVGTIERGKIANLVILDQPMKSTSRYLPNYAWKTIVEGKVAFDME